MRERQGLDLQRIKDFTVEAIAALSETRGGTTSSMPSGTSRNATRLARGEWRNDNAMLRPSSSSWMVMAIAPRHGTRPSPSRAQTRGPPPLPANAGRGNKTTSLAPLAGRGWGPGAVATGRARGGFRGDG